MTLASIYLAPETVFAQGVDWGAGEEQNESTEETVISDGGEIEWRIDCTVVRNDSRSSTDVTSESWALPVCWYEPCPYDEVLDWAEGIRSHWQRRGRDEHGVAALHVESYFNGDPYAIEDMADDDGYFYMAAWNPERVGSASAGGCSALPFWVDSGAAAENSLALTPELMAETAYDRMPLPEPEIQLSPEETQLVNLDTWIWLDPGELTEVSVTATLTMTDWQVPVVARPVELWIDPGAADVSGHPESGGCVIGEDGSAGEPWNPAREGESPPCGVTCRHTGSATLTASVIWEVSWHGTGSPDPQPCHVRP